ncbi:hypothetical protein ILUMI_19860 [Ignelater luminosus]|uniref:Uncharacterized protein n=1 Tax=Ignelater luminosus TaxID=2038154 RepID=A0A8K0CFD5_IGNLU|nr:hypothetical protein ILUMI_19860 [Ignelater luminosus]
MVFNGFKACGIFPWSVDSIDLSKCIGTPSKERNKKAKTEKKLEEARKQFIQNEKKKYTEIKGRRAKKNQDQHTSKIDSTLENHTITKLIPEKSSNKINKLQKILIDSKLLGNDHDTQLKKNSKVENCKRFIYADSSDDGIHDVGKSDLNLRNNTLVCNGLCFIYVNNVYKTNLGTKCIKCPRVYHYGCLKKKEIYKENYCCSTCLKKSKLPCSIFYD